jgi:NAD(P)-dependent dehydrogenase (short-subunit alcohol dehydrogenase family)
MMAFVTGAASGIGRAVAERLAGDGYAVVGFDSAAAPADVPRGVTYVRGDVAQPGELDAAIDAAAGAYGSIDVLCTCAAIKRPDDEAGSFERMLAVNAGGTMNACNSALRHMRRAKRGSIVTIGSNSADGDAAAVGYAASKGAVIALTRSLALRMIPAHVRVNCVVPGLTESGMTTEIAAEVLAARGQRNVSGAPNRAADVADVIAFLASDRARTMSGAIVHVGTHAGQGVAR